MDEKIVNVEGIYCYEADGTAHLNLEQMAYGLGLTREQTINGAQYTGVQWRRVDKYLKDLGFPDKWGKDLYETYGKRPEFIPENIFTRMAMKAKSKKASDFHAWVMNEVVPRIHKPVVSVEPVSAEPVREYTETTKYMATGYQIFTSPTFGEIRGMKINGEPWVVGKDVAEKLGYSDPKAAVRDHVDSEDKQVIQKGQIAPLENHIPQSVLQINFVYADIPNRGLTVINESGLYSLVLSSKLPDAKKFRRWVTSEVLPSIRKHGAYATPQAVERFLNDPDAIIKIATNWKNERDRRIALEADNAKLTAQIEEDAPRVQWAKTAEGSKTGTLIREFVKFLLPLGVNIGEKRMFEDLRNNGYLIRANGRDRNKPTQKSMELGLFAVKEVIVARPDGTTDTYSTPLLTEKGKQYFTDWYLKRQGISQS